MVAIHRGGGVEVSARAGAERRSDTLEAARLAYRFQVGGPVKASEQELIDNGYLKETWTNREKVDIAPIELPVAETPREAPIEPALNEAPVQAPL